MKAYKIFSLQLSNTWYSVINYGHVPLSGLSYFIKTQNASSCLHGHVLLLSVSFWFYQTCCRSKHRVLFHFMDRPPSVYPPADGPLGSFRSSALSNRTQTRAKEQGSSCSFSGSHTCSPCLTSRGPWSQTTLLGTCALSLDTDTTCAFIFPG